MQLLPRSNDETVWHIFPIRVAPAKRDALRAALAEANVDTTVHYPSLPEQPAFRGCPGEARVTARESRKVLSLPMHRALDENEVDRIADVIRRVVG